LAASWKILHLTHLTNQLAAHLSAHTFLTVDVHLSNKHHLKASLWWLHWVALWQKQLHAVVATCGAAEVASWTFQSKHQNQQRERNIGGTLEYTPTAAVSSDGTYCMSTIRA